jgi:thymidylate kinase
MENIIENKAVSAEVIFRRRADGVTRASRELLAALQQNKVRFAHWKSNSHLAEGLAGKTDLDLLVYPQDQQAFEATLRQLCYKKIRSQPWSSYPQVEDWIGLDEETGRLLHVHTHYALVTGIKHVKHLYLPWTEEFFRQLKTDEQTGWPVPKAELEALILFIRIWAKMPPGARISRQPQIPVYMQQELLGLLIQSQPDQLREIGSKLQLQLPADMDSRIRKIIAENNTPEILGLARYFYAQVKPYYRKAWPLALAESFYYKMALKISPRLTRFLGPTRMGKQLVGEGKIIALIGCDGSGKSSLSQDLLAWLTYKIDTHYFYLGKNPFIKSYNKIVLAKEDFLFGRSFLARGIKKLIGKYYFIILIRRKVAMLRLAKEMRKQGSIILCDRFPQQEIPGLNDGPNLSQSSNKRAAEWEQQQFKRVKSLGADLVFRLRVSPEVAAQRKPEHDFEKIKLKSESINKILLPESVMIDIDSDQSYEQVLLKIKQIIWKYL